MVPGEEQRLRVLLVANTLPPRDLSGVGEQVLQLAEGLREAGHTVEVLGRGVGGARGPKTLFPLTVAVPFWRTLRRFRPHVVQVHESDGAVAAWITALLAGILRPRPVLVALLQVSYLEEWRAVRTLRSPAGVVLGRPGAVELRFKWLKAPLQILLGRLTAWLADRVMAPSARTAAELERDYGVSGVEVLPNVTGALSWEQAPDAAEVGGGGADSLLFVGRLRIRKGVEVLLQAVAELSRRGAPVDLVVVGDGEHRRRLDRRIAELGLDGRVRMLGRRSPGEVRQALATARALVVPSIYEGMPLVVLEAMELSVPVIASRVSGIPEVVVDGVTGWVVEAESVDELAAALAEVSRDPTEARRRGVAGRSRLDEHYRGVHAVRRWLEILEKARVPAESPDAESPEGGRPSAADRR